MEVPGVLTISLNLPSSAVSVSHVGQFPASWLDCHGCHTVPIPGKTNRNQCRARSYVYSAELFPRRGHKVVVGNGDSSAVTVDTYFNRFQVPFRLQILYNYSLTPVHSGRTQDK